MCCSFEEGEQLVEDSQTDVYVVQECRPEPKTLTELVCGLIKCVCWCIYPRYLNVEEQRTMYIVELLDSLYVASSLLEALMRNDKVIKGT